MPNAGGVSNSNTTLVKVKFLRLSLKLLSFQYSNTTLVKVKLTNAGISALGNKIFKYNSC